MRKLARDWGWAPLLLLAVAAVQARDAGKAKPGCGGRAPAGYALVSSKDGVSVYRTGKPGRLVAIQCHEGARASKAWVGDLQGALDLMEGPSGSLRFDLHRAGVRSRTYFQNTARDVVQITFIDKEGDPGAEAGDQVALGAAVAAIEGE